MRREHSSLQVVDLVALRGWLAALANVRNWLIRETALSGQFLIYSHCFAPAGTVSEDVTYLDLDLDVGVWQDYTRALRFPRRRLAQPRWLHPAERER